MSLFFYRMMGAAMLDHAMYEGLEADRSLTGQATGVVVLSSLAAGLGAGGIYGPGVETFVVVTALSLAGWVAWAMLMFQIGTRVLPEPQTQATLGELLRTVGFATAPGLFLIFAVFPVMAVPVFAATAVWMFAAMVVGVRHALDFRHTWRALAVCGLAVALITAVAVLLALAFGRTVL